MKTLLVKLIIILAITSIICSAQDGIDVQQSQQTIKFPFQRKIWTYWNSDKNQVPLIVKVCLDNLQSVAKKHNFTFVCLNDQNVRKYITNYDEQFIQVRKKSIQNDFAHIADLLRMIVLQQQGGIWVDSTTIFLNGLTQLQNIMSQKYAHMITNRFSPQPDALLFYYSMGQNRIQQKIINPRNIFQTILYNEMPDYQIWFIATKKQSPVIKDMKKSYVEFTTTSFDEVEKKFRDQEIFINRIDDFGHYLYLNMAVAYTLQKKQAQLDRNLSLFGQRKSVHEEYKLWGLHSQYGPMIMIRQDLISLDSLFLYSQQELKAMGWNFIFFMKQFGYFRYYMGWYLDNLIAAFKDFNGSFNDWLSAKPDAGYCENLTLIIKDSILHKMLEKSTVLNSTKGLRIFTKEQLTKWNEYCSHYSLFTTKLIKFFKNSIFHTLILRLFMYDKVQKAKVHQILAQGQKLSLMDWVKIKYQDNSFLLFDSGYFLIVALLMFWVYKKLIYKFSKMLENYKEENSSNESHFDLSNKHSSFNKFSILKTVSQLHNTQGPQTKSKQTFLSFLIFLLLFSSLIMYNSVDLTGGRQQPYTIFLFIIFTFLIEFYIEKQTKSTGNKDKKYFLKIKYEYEFFFLFVNYITAYMALVYIRRNRYWLNWCALVIGCIGPCVLKMARQMNYKYEGQFDSQQRKYKIKSQSFILGTNKIRLLIILASAFITFVPNIRFLSTNSGYIIQYLPMVPLAYLGILSLYVAYKAIVERYWLQLMRLIIIAIVIGQMCSMTERIGFIIHLALRMMFVFRTVVILQAVYLQAGSSISIKNLHQYKFMKSFLNQVLIFICPFFIEFLFGRFYWNIEKISYLYYDYTEQLVIYGYSAFLVAMLTSLEKNNQYQSIENIELNEIQHSEMS